MRQYIIIALACLAVTGCKKDNEKDSGVTSVTTPAETQALAFSAKNYTKKTALPCKQENCTYVSISVPEASGKQVVSDSINKKVFNTVRNIVYFGEKPTNSTNYKDLMDSFVKSYEDLATKYPADAIPWEAKIKATKDYESDNVVGIKVNNYMYTGGAHGYEGNLSLLFNAETGKSLSHDDILKDKKAFTAVAEKKFRDKFKIPAGKSINSTGLFFENDKFVLPQNIFFRENGLVLYYNSVEIGSFADGPRELLIPYAEADQYLKIK